MRRHCLKALEAVSSFKNLCVNCVAPPVVVLLYHRVNELEVDSQQLAVSPENFRAQLRFLKDHFPLLSLDADWSKVKEPSVAVSFDDGYADNYVNALPAIDSVGIPVTFFVTTGYVDSIREFWWDELERIILTPQSAPPLFELQDVRNSGAWPTGTKKERIRLFFDLQLKMRKVDPAHREEWFQQLREWAEVGIDGRQTHRALTLSQLQQLASNRWVTIGAHTVSHTPLSALGAKSQRREIAAARKQLESWLEMDVSLFSYPFGGPEDFTDETVQLVRECGYERAYVNHPGQVHRWTDPYRLPRHLVRNWPVDLFARHLKRFWTYAA